MAITRQTIVSNLKTLLQTISVANGYYTALGSNVKLFSVLPVQEDELPCVIIYDKSDSIDGEGTQGSYNIWNKTLKVTLQIVCSGNTPDTTIRQLITDCYKAIGSDNTLSGNCLQINAIGDSIDLEQQSQKIMGAAIELEILYRTKRFAESFSGDFSDDISTEADIYIGIEH